MKYNSGPWRVVGHGESNANVGCRRDRDDAIAIMLSSMPLARVRLLIFRLVLVSPVALVAWGMYQYFRMSSIFRICCGLLAFDSVLGLLLSAYLFPILFGVTITQFQQKKMR